MLAIQEYLFSGKTLDDVKSEFGINVYEHPTLPLVGFKYSQIESPKTHPVVRDCRGIVLEKNTWNCVAKPFKRFFNVGEDNENFQKFTWDNFTCTSKEDGSLMIVYFYQGEWHVNTSGSFGLGECQFSGMTWRELFWKTSNISKKRLKPDSTYIFELCTPFNKIVRTYPKSTVYLLSMFDINTLQEHTIEHVDNVARHLDVKRPTHYHFKSMDEVSAFLRGVEEGDKTFEGIILRGSDDERFKAKSQTYVALHHLKDNGNICNPKRLVPLVLAGEVDEVLAYLPEVEPYLRDCEAKIDEAWTALSNVWWENWQIEGQKEFAIAINKGFTRFTGLLFTLRKKYGKDQTEELLKQLWREHGDGIVKVLYG